MDNAQTIIKKLMSSIDQSSSGGITALDEAIRSCSNFGSSRQLVDSFIDSINTMKRQGASTDTILSDLCGIDLTNSDTGAISGSDAGSGNTQTAESIIYEPPYTSSKYSYPVAGSNNFRTIGGVRVYCPFSYSSESEEALASGLFNNGWIERSLELIQSSYGLSFNEPDATPCAIRIGFFDKPVSSDGSITFAQTSNNTYINGRMIININFNRAAFDQGFYLTKGTNASGYSKYTNSRGGTSVENCWDRIVAHELVHAVMDANFNGITSFPSYFREGSAELIHGADDERANDIRTLINDTERLSAGLSRSYSNPDPIVPYAGGYMLLRYLAKQASQGSTTPATPPSTTTLPTGTGYNTEHTALIAEAGFSGTLWLDSESGHQYDSTVNTINAAQTSGSVILVGRKNTDSTLIGGSGSNAMWGGFGGNDNMTGGSGTNVYWFGANDGYDVVTNYASGRDSVYWYGGACTGITTSGISVALKGSNSALYLKDMAGQKITLTTPVASINAIIGCEDAANTLTWQSDVNYYQGSTTYTDTLKITTTTDVSLANNTAYTYVNIDNIDASAATGSTILIGSTGNNVLTASKSGSQIWGGFGGDDTLVGGSSYDRFWYGSGDGSDTIQGATVEDILYFYDPGFHVGSITQNGSDLVIGNAAGGSLTVKDWTGNSTLQLSDGSTWQLTKQGNSFKTTKL